MSSGRIWTRGKYRAGDMLGAKMQLSCILESSRKEDGDVCVSTGCTYCILLSRLLRLQVACQIFVYCFSGIIFARVFVPVQQETKFRGSC